MRGGADSPGSRTRGLCPVYEHCRFGIGFGLFRGGDYIGESLVAGPKALRVHYVNLAIQALLRSGVFMV